MHDTARADAKDALGKLNALGISPVMLTGDAERVAKRMAGELGIDYRAQLLPEDKLNVLAELRNDPARKGPIAMVGDGINDAPALKSADVGIAIGGVRILRLRPPMRWRSRTGFRMLSIW